MSMLINSLFCGGHWPISVESVWLIGKGQQFQETAKGITYLDTMLSGAGMQFYRAVTASEVSKLKNLFASKWTEKREYPEYVYSTFECFVQHKVHIRLNFLHLERYVKEMRNLLLHSMDKSNTNLSQKYVIKRRKEGDFDNLFRPELLEIFPHVRTMTIDTTVPYCYNKYTISLLSLLSLIERSALQQVVLIGEEWLAWNSEEHWKQEPKEFIEQRYNKAKYTIKVESKTKRMRIDDIFDEESGDEDDRFYVYQVYHCVIEKK